MTFGTFVPSRGTASYPQSRQQVNPYPCSPPQPADVGNLHSCAQMPGLLLGTHNVARERGKQGQSRVIMEVLVSSLRMSSGLNQILVIVTKALLIMLLQILRLS